ncbi:hypothetical protein HaLaN_11345 [Haematococcus lacustris]|uniref:Uncharacterized protein n=1 Tax=Haematococcus lacustris TaxID=44745 RepID=A0A699YY10_HAELA|nr:hypothetical protein HaLaN_11345 [Haematococcus lacustris]
MEQLVIVCHPLCQYWPSRKRGPQGQVQAHAPGAHGTMPGATTASQPNGKGGWTRTPTHASTSSPLGKSVQRVAKLQHSEVTVPAVPAVLVGCSVGPSEQAGDCQSSTR